VRDFEIEKALAFIDEHIEEKLSVAELATQFNFSEQYFRKLFTSVIGVPPKRYIEKSKLERAFVCIKTTNLSISEIAYKFNYSSSHHFTNAFKKEYNMSPTECRQTSL
jgi:AraC-like DNA-binding protein